MSRPEKYSTFGVLLPHSVERAEGWFYTFDVYDAYTGALKDKVKIEKAQYDLEKKHLSGNEPRFVIASGELQFSIDSQSHYPEIRVYEYAVLPGRISIPDSLVSTVAPQIAPLKFKPSLEKGYQVIADDF